MNPTLYDALIGVPEAGDLRSTVQAYCENTASSTADARSGERHTRDQLASALSASSTLRYELLTNLQHEQFVGALEAAYVKYKQLTEPSRLSRHIADTAYQHTDNLNEVF